MVRVLVDSIGGAAGIMLAAVVLVDSIARVMAMGFLVKPAWGGYGIDPSGRIASQEPSGSQGGILTLKGIGKHPQ